MRLQKKGNEVAAMSREKRLKVAQELLSGKRNVTDYLEFPVCYDAAAFLKFLMAPDGDFSPLKISRDMLLTKKSNLWPQQFQSDDYWQYNSPIEPGSIVTFYGLDGGGQWAPIHASVAVGGTKVRGINGGRLGASWM